MYCSGLSIAKPARYPAVLSPTFWTVNTATCGSVSARSEDPGTEGERGTNGDPGTNGNPRTNGDPGTNGEPGTDGLYTSEQIVTGIGLLGSRLSVAVPLDPPGTTVPPQPVSGEQLELGMPLISCTSTCTLAFAGADAS